MTLAARSNMSSREAWVSQFNVRQADSRRLWCAIYAEFERQGPPMTVRQVFYRMSTQGEVEKSELGYRRVQHQLTNMRAAGAIPYSWLADNGRWVRTPRSYESLGAMLAEAQTFYRRALWASQPVHVEIWLEKDALSGVIHSVTEHWDVPLYVTRGYPSLSYLYTAAEALRAIDKQKIIYYFGDYDASGKDAARSVRDGLRKFGAEFHLEERAVTEAQIAAMNLPTRPAKDADPRAKGWGSIAVELDAIEPSTLREMVDQCIQQHVDVGELNKLRQIERAEKATLRGLIGEYGTSSKFGQNGGAA